MSDVTQEDTRRKVLTVIGSTGASALAGCTSLFGGSDASEAPTSASETTEEQAPTSTTPTPPQRTLSGDWQSFQGNPGNTGGAQGEVGPTDNVEIAWEKDVGGSYSGPIIDKNTVYMSAGGALVAINAVTGTELWKKDLPGGAYSTPATGPANVFVCTDVNLLAYNKETGQKQWEKPLSAEDSARPKVINDSVYLHGSSRLYSLNREDGSVEWYHREVDTHQPKTVAYTDGKVYYINQLGELIAANVSDGKKVWEKTFGESLTSSTVPTVQDGVLYVPGRFNQMFKIDAETGEVIWTGNIDEDSYYDGYQSPAVDETHIYEYTFYRLIARNKETGTQDWLYQFEANDNSGVIQPPVASNDTVYVGTRTGKVMALSAGEGIVRWQKQLLDNQEIWGTPCLTDEYLFTNGGGTLFALRGDM